MDNERGIVLLAHSKAIAARKGVATDKAIGSTPRECRQLAAPIGKLDIGAQQGFDPQHERKVSNKGDAGQGRGVVSRDPDNDAGGCGGGSRLA